MMFKRVDSFRVRQSTDIGLHRYMLSIYKYMGMGLALTGIVSLLLALMPPAAQGVIYSLSWMALFGTLGIAIYFNAASQRMSVATAQGLFWLYSALMGVSLTWIFAIYRAESIAKVFFIAASTFGAASLYGHTTQKDLTSIRSFCVMGLWGLIIASIVNIFFRSGAFDFALSCIGVVVFVGLSAYDTQNLRQMYYHLPHDEDLRAKMSIFGALNLYLDCVNLFLFLLRLMGDERK